MSIKVCLTREGHTSNSQGELKNSTVIHGKEKQKRESSSQQMSHKPGLIITLV